MGDYVWVDEGEFIRFLHSDGMVPPESFMPYFLRLGYLQAEE